MIKRTPKCTWRSWKVSFKERMPRVPARELHAEDTLKRQLPPFLDSLASPLQIRVGGKTLVGQQRHCCEAHVAERRVVLSASHPEVRADSGIAEERERWCWEAWVPWECHRGWVCSVRRASSWGRRRSKMRWKVSTCWRRVMGENGGICRGTLWWGNNSTEQVACCSVLPLIDIIEYDGAGNKTFGYKKETRYHI